MLPVPFTDTNTVPYAKSMFGNPSEVLALILLLFFVEGMMFACRSRPAAAQYIRLWWKRN
ncbi:hypothetical protein P691DRAFT_812497 [Macrolepiota fuliginosa MF-IS2]|uniref:Uncharacterized protein n=1 Tax=Macrolepiota fuliginosa MF-IS2 TaxID=1400762 RepID=A0A9P5XQC9_9AGAR|nr:hypothetical protein P691DRAFT_812497 [Macrolepiota fuliginosa MF-IS2]